MTKVTLKTIDNQINTLVANRDKLRDHAQSIAMMIFMHAAPKEVSPDCNGTGDCTRAAVLVGALPKGWADLMKKWFTAVSPIRVNGTNVGYDKKYLKLSPENKLAWWKIAEANETPFHAIDPKDNGLGETQKLSMSDLLKMLQSVGKRIDAMLEDESGTATKVIAEEDKVKARALAIQLKNFSVQQIVTNAADNMNDAAEEMRRAANG